MVLLMLEYISTRHREKIVNVQLEQFSNNDLNRLFPGKHLNTPFIVNINLFVLAYQMHLSKPMSKISESPRTKFKDYVPYIKRITNNRTLDFFITDMDSEDKQQASKIIGEGISRCIILSLFELQENSLRKIRGPGLRPDFEAISNSGELIVCESKGSFNNVDSSRVSKALRQKNSRNAQIKIAAINNIGNISRLIDPPVDEDERMEDRFSNLIRKTDHYIQVFRLAGQKELTKYFKLMKKRFENRNMTNFPEFSEKKELWFKLKYERQRVRINQKEYIGKVEIIENNRIMYVGFDEELLNVDSFEKFRDYEKEYYEKQYGKIFYISKDGVCFIEADLEKLNELFPGIDSGELKNYQESMWLSDIDNMNELEFSNYLKFIFQKNNIDYRYGIRINDVLMDFEIIHSNKKYYLEIKLFPKNFILSDSKKLNQVRETLKQRLRFLDKKDKRNLILIVNMDKRLVKIPDEIIVFDRNDLKKLLRNKEYFSEFLSNI